MKKVVVLLAAFASTLSAGEIMAENANFHSYKEKLTIINHAQIPYIISQDPSITPVGISEIDGYESGASISIQPHSKRTLIIYGYNSSINKESQPYASHVGFRVETNDSALVGSFDVTHTYAFPGSSNTFTAIGDAFETKANQFTFSPSGLTANPNAPLSVIINS